MNIPHPDGGLRTKEIWNFHDRCFLGIKDLTVKYLLKVNDKNLLIDASFFLVSGLAQECANHSLTKIPYEKARIPKYIIDTVKQRINANEEIGDSERETLEAFLGECQAKIITSFNAVKRATREHANQRTP